LTAEELAKVWKTSYRTDLSVYGPFIRLALLSAQRKGQWYQFRPDFLQGDTVVFPASVMKANRTHVLPLTPSVAELLAHHPFGCWNETNRKWQFHKLSGTSGWTLHDLRRTAATGMAELGVAPHVVERILAHSTGVISGVAARYNRAAYLAEMREALQLWQSYLARL
jgi:integrase